MSVDGIRALSLSVHAGIQTRPRQMHCYLDGPNTRVAKGELLNRGAPLLKGEGGRRQGNADTATVVCCTCIHCYHRVPISSSAPRAARSHCPRPRHATPQEAYPRPPKSRLSRVQNSVSLITCYPCHIVPKSGVGARTRAPPLATSRASPKIDRPAPPSRRPSAD